MSALTLKKPITDPQTERAEAIGLFDSGIGGLTVMEALSEFLPLEKMIYFGDTARVPYGGKSPETILKYSIENTIFLLQKDVKCLVIACNTATSIALEKLQKMFKIPIIGVIDAAVEEALSVSVKGRIAILGTKATIASQAYQSKLVASRDGIFSIGIPCPMLTTLAEESLIQHEATDLFLKEYAQKALDADVDTLILGCTHYPLFEKSLQKIVGDRIKIVNSATACAQSVQKTLEKEKISTKEKSPPFHYPIYVSDDPEQFKKTALTFLKPSSCSILRDSLSFIQNSNKREF